MKKNFKKIVAAATVLGLTLSMSVAAFADDYKYDREAHDTTASTKFDSRTEKYSEDSFNYLFDNATTGAKDSTDTANVKVKVDDTKCVKVYNVTVDWEELKFTYTFNESSIWDPESHKYVASSSTTTATDPGSWSGAKKVTITNHSNAVLTTKIETAKADEFYNVSVAGAVASDSDADLDDASECAYNDTSKADKAVYEISVSGVPTKSDLDGAVIGTVTVTISQKAST